MIEGDFSLGHLIGAHREQRIIDITYNKGNSKAQVVSIDIKAHKLIFSVKQQNWKQATPEEISVNLKDARFYLNILGQVEIIDATNETVFQLNLKTRNVN